MIMYFDYVLIIIMIVFFLIVSWVLWLCEMSDIVDEFVYLNLFNMMWLVVIMFFFCGVWRYKVEYLLWEGYCCDYGYDGGGMYCFGCSSFS